MNTETYNGILTVLNQDNLQAGLQAHPFLQKCMTRAVNQLADENPEDASVNLRKSVEYLTMQYQFANNIEPEENGILLSAIDQLKAKNIITEKTASLFHRIRKVANHGGAHIGDPIPEPIVREALAELVLSISGFLSAIPEEQTRHQEGVKKANTRLASDAYLDYASDFRDVYFKKGIYGKVILDPRLSEMTTHVVDLCRAEDLNNITEIIIPKNCDCGSRLIATLIYDYKIKVTGYPDSPYLPYKDGIFYTPDFRTARVICAYPDAVIRVDERCTSFDLAGCLDLEAVWDEDNWSDDFIVDDIANDYKKFFEPPAYEYDVLPYKATLSMRAEQYVNCPTIVTNISLWRFLSYTKNIEVVLDELKAPDHRFWEKEAGGKKTTVRLYDDVLYMHFEYADPKKEDVWDFATLKYNKKVYRVPEWLPYKWLNTHTEGGKSLGRYAMRFFPELKYSDNTVHKFLEFIPDYRERRHAFYKKYYQYRVIFEGAHVAEYKDFIYEHMNIYWFYDPLSRMWDQFSVDENNPYYYVKDNTLYDKKTNEAIFSMTKEGRRTIKEERAKQREEEARQKQKEKEERDALAAKAYAPLYAAQQAKARKEASQNQQKKDAASKTTSFFKKLFGGK